MNICWVNIGLYSTLIKIKPILNFPRSFFLVELKHVLKLIKAASPFEDVKAIFGIQTRMYLLTNMNK